MNLSDQLLLMLAHDRTLSGATVIEAATALGWYGQRGAARSPLLNRLHARIEAERWLSQLQRRARSWRYYVGSQQAAAARLLLGRGRAYVRPILLIVVVPELVVVLAVWAGF